MQRKNDLMEMASDLKITVVNAKSSDDGQLPAIHLLNPDLDALEDAIFDADGKGFDTIVIHRKETWPYKVTVEKVATDKMVS